MNLLIEGGILLKPHARPWHPSGWGHAPKGWTPDCGEWVQNHADELQQAEPNLPREFALLKAEQAHGELLYKARKPWPGWVPVNAEVDKKINRAYRELFQRINPNHVSHLPAKAARWPGDGRYRIIKIKDQNGQLIDIMEMVPNDPTS